MSWFWGALQLHPRAQQYSPFPEVCHLKRKAKVSINQTNSNSQKQITIYFARWLAIRVPRDPVKISCSLLFDFFYKNLTHRGYCYNDNTVTDDFEICQKFFLKQYLPLVFPFKISKLSFSLDSRRLFSRFSWSRNIFFNLGNYQLGFGKHGADRARDKADSKPWECKQKLDASGCKHRKYA